nr:MAG TPA: hypothetical protein [Caudoviricetes sp.]
MNSHSYVIILIIVYLSTIYILIIKHMNKYSYNMQFYI